ncbi:MAG: hypothetical protein A2W91_01765 [Bacteroidetes bacterium GWF2_38_335]|nr:MAG: hypothetical protein A2W91_01765 [Bacteroidetes bacterium GWF2_38_335]OFY78795.1 MAG: hypothetical protein A2281_19340 [Bacteroidetes bacterium RIFOXYA12_FULL_38_20]HBS85191.1 TolC family protein [Bacteroidales bacterium]
MIYKILTILFLAPVMLFSQNTLSLRNAIDSALQNNFDIQISGNILEMSKNNNSYGMAGGMPTVGIAAGDNNSVYNLDQKLSTGSEISKQGVTSNSLTAGVSAGIVLFNGFKVMATKERLNQLQMQTELQLNSQIQNILAAIMVVYYDIVRQQGYLQILQKNLEVSEKKSEVIKARKNVGMANDADILQSDIDMSMIAQNIESQKLMVDRQKNELLQLMGVKAFYGFSVSDTIETGSGIQKDSIINFLEKNPQYLSADMQVKINEQIVKEMRAQRYPSIKVNTGYNFSHSSNSAGFNLYNQNYGPYVGATLAIPIFNGNIYKKQQENAMLSVENALLEKESLLMSLKATVENTFDTYQTTLQQLESQKVNYQNAGKLLDLIMEKFKVNEATILEVKAAQQSYENAGYLLLNLQYAAKAAEIELKRLVYKLGN